MSGQPQLMPAGAPNAMGNPCYMTSTAEAEELKRFLTTAPQLWTKTDDPPIRAYSLSNGDHISCILWRGKFFITGTDIVKILLFRFAQAGRPVLNVKKFEEGVFSDLRNLKPGTEAVLEEPRSEFLDFLFKHGCIRTQKKQKVFFWNCVPHESLFLDAIERDFKREGSLYHMNLMMNHTRYLQKQVAMMQATALQHQFTAATGGATANGAPPPALMNMNMSMMAPPPPQMMPNTTRASGTPAFPVPAAYPPMMGNTVDPFLFGSQMRMAPVPTTHSKLPLNPLGMGRMPAPTPQAPNFPLDLSDFEVAGTNDPMLSSYFSHTSVEEPAMDSYIDPSVMQLHEY